ncbi:MAG TPA: arylamine N-acetyltransferase [Anaerolineales bacterium]|nr:arylamine N-acetyltransferase [Anaerolineales bacterium]
MDIPTYLKRIGYDQAVQPNHATLCGIHRAHMLHVPFENLDIMPLHKPIRLDEQSLWDKIVVRRRGGFCYELNGLFAWLLKQIGFGVTYLNGRVFTHDGSLGIDFDHLALLVHASGESARWLADVGFGDSFMEPLRLEDRGAQTQGLRAYRLEETSDGYTIWQRNDGLWNREYLFDLQPRDFPHDYAAACLYHQTSPQSHFTRQGIISRATMDGRISLEAGRLIITEGGRRREHPVAGAEEYRALLNAHFGVVI